LQAQLRLPTNFDSGALAGHLRLVAAIGLTKLATYREYDRLIANASFEEIAYQIQVGTALLNGRQYAELTNMLVVTRMHITLYG